MALARRFLKECTTHSAQTQCAQYIVHYTQPQVYINNHVSGFRQCFDTVFTVHEPRMQRIKHRVHTTHFQDRHHDASNIIFCFVKPSPAASFSCILCLMKTMRNWYVLECVYVSLFDAYKMWIIYLLRLETILSDIFGQTTQLITTVFFVYSTLKWPKSGRKTTRAERREFKSYTNIYSNTYANSI